MLAEALMTAATVFGHSVQGAPIRALAQGTGDVNVLVVGSIHGNERAGEAIVRRLRAQRPGTGVRLWTVRTVNPDSRTRHNARGVDLNRNFPRGWRRGGGIYSSGPRAASEPETRAVMRMVRRIRPDVTVWFHQHLDCVNPSHGADREMVRSYARFTGLRECALPRYPGTATRWQNATFPGASAFVVELPAGRLSARAVRLHTAAVLHMGERAAAARTSAVRPAIKRDLIAFGPLRVRQMRRYSRRHYGTPIARLQPKQVVQHVTAGGTYSSVRSHFERNVPDPELGELPQVCAHFLVDRDGTIGQLVPLRLRCRHTVGLNHVAIGIEHVARTDAELMGNRRQLAASLRLTRWLQQEHGIATRDVIGHNESLRSRFHHENVKRLRTQTHGDMAPATMRRYRGRL